MNLSNIYSQILVIGCQFQVVGFKRLCYLVQVPFKIFNIVP